MRECLVEWRKWERFWWGSWVFSHSPPFVMVLKAPHFGEKMWWEEGVLWEITYQPPSLPTYVCGVVVVVVVVVVFLFLFLFLLLLLFFKDKNLLQTKLQ